MDKDSDLVVETKNGSAGAGAGYTHAAARGRGKVRPRARLFRNVDAKRCRGGGNAAQPDPLSFRFAGCLAAGAARLPEPATHRTPTVDLCGRYAVVERWDKACDYLDEDIASGYVRILQEMMAAGWSNPEVAAAIRRIIGEWQALLNVVAEEATKRLGPISGLQAQRYREPRRYCLPRQRGNDLLGFEEEGVPIRRALRRVGALIRIAEEINNHRRLAMRAKLPVKDGFVDRDGVKIHYEVYGGGSKHSSSSRPGASSTRGSTRRTAIFQ